MILKLEAAKPAEVKVVSDGKTIFEGNVTGGQVRLFAARDSFEISSSDSSAIVLSLNGQSVPASGQPGEPGVVTLTQKDLKPVAGDPH